MAGEFDGCPLVAGTVRVVRRFRVDELGRLRSPQQGTVWRPGDNTAECRIDQNVGQYRIAPGGTVQVNIGAGRWVTYGGASVTAGTVTHRQAQHSMGSCKCGYYAYSDGHDAAEYGGPDTVAAVVEGWGDVLLGTRGFRAQHAKVLAVTIPGQDAPPTRLLAANDVKSWRPYGFGWVWLASAFAEAAYGGVKYATGEPFWWVFLVLALVLTFIAFRSSHGERERREKLRRMRSMAVTTFEPPPEAVVAAFRANYPDVAVYSSYGAMVADFPPDPGDRPSPANDPAFWERP